MATPEEFNPAQARQRWVKSKLGEAWSLSPASSDASFRSYWRLSHPDHPSYILMDAPPDKEDSKPFIYVDRKLRGAGLFAPQIFASDLDAGYLLLEDLGDTQLASLLDQETANDLYESALRALITMQQINPDGLPEYDEALLLNELALFSDWLVDRHLATDQFSDWQTIQQRLVQNAINQQQVFVHRDYHSRNLMYNPDNPDHPGIIDFQDAVKGPVTYDAVSLLRDCYVRWPDEQVNTWSHMFLDMVNGHRSEEISVDDWDRWFDLMGIQRHLKAAGIFCRLNHRDGKSSYLQDVPRTLSYVVDSSAKYPELNAFGEWVDQEILPRFKHSLCAL